MNQWGDCFAQSDCFGFARLAVLSDQFFCGLQAVFVATVKAVV